MSLHEQPAPDTDTPSYTTELITDSLRPSIEKDEAGFQRAIYHHGNLSFSFRGREELPTTPSMLTRYSTLLGEAPNWAKEDEWETYQTRARYTQVLNTHTNPHNITTTTPRGIVELALALNPTNHDLKKIHQMLQEGVYSPEANLVADAIIAARFINETQQTWDDTPNPHGFALVTLALTGDPAANFIVQNKVRTLHALQKQNIPTLDTPKSEAEPLSPSKLVCVHTTRYPPIKYADHQYAIPTTFEATHGKIPRITTHVALNHKVENAGVGNNWLEQRYTLIAPLSDMLHANGVPDMLNTVDTWWALNPSEKLVWLNAVLVRPATLEELEPNQIYTHVGNEVAVRTITTKAELQQALNFLKQSGFDQDDMWRVKNSIGEVLGDIFNRWTLEHGKLQSATEHIRTSGFDIAKAFEKVQKKLWDRVGVSHAYTALADHLLDSEEDSVDGCMVSSLTALLDEVRIEENWPISTLELEQIVNVFAHDNRDAIIARTQTKVDTTIVNLVMQELGFQPQPGGMWAWGDSFTITDRTYALAHALGSRAGNHSNSQEEAFEKNMLRALPIQQAQHWDRYDDEPITKQIPHLYDKEARAICFSGLLNTRL